METAVIELNDLAIIATRSGQQQISSGYAFVGENQVLLGESARLQARQFPRQTIHSYWQNLDSSALSENMAGARHHADIAYQQLLALYESMGKPDDIVFVLPASFTKQHMALLLGLAQQCPFNAVAIVDYAVAALAGQFGVQEQASLFEIQLHQTSSYRVKRQQELLLQDSSSVTLGGYYELLETCVALIAKEFIAQCRFDPLHDANSEQQLFLDVDKWLREPEGEKLFELQSGGRLLSTRVHSDCLHACMNRFATQLMQANSGLAPDFIGANLAQIPSLRRFFEQAVAVSITATADSCIERIDDLCSYSNSLAYIKQMHVGVLDAHILPEAVDIAVPGVLPSHFLLDSCAYSLTNGPLYFTAVGKAIVHSGHESGSAQLQISVTPEGISMQALHGSQVVLNGKLHAQAYLRRGDVLSLNEQGCTIQLIELISNHEP